MHRLHSFVLEGGLRVQVVQTPHLHGAMVAAYLGVGSRHEAAKVNGVSHFLEHMLFRGCDRWPDSHSLNASVEPFGGSMNGATTRDHTVYYTAVHPSGVAFALEVLGAMIGAPRLEGIELEREVVLEEILDEVDERGRVVDIETLSRRQVFGPHPMGQPIAGDRETVSAVTRKDLRDHHRRFYTARNLVITVAGPVEPEAVRDAAARAFAALPVGTAAAVEAPPAFPEGRLVELVSHRDSQSELALTFPAYPESHPDHLAAVALQRILDDGLASRLQQNIVERRGLAYDVGAALDVWADAGLFTLEAATAHDRVPNLVEAILDTLRDLVQSPPTQDELARAQARYRFGVEMLQDSVADLAGWFGEAELIHRAVSLEDRLAGMAAVTPEDVNRVAQACFGSDRMAAVVVGHPPGRATRRALENGRLAA